MTSPARGVVVADHPRIGVRRVGPQDPRKEKNNQQLERGRATNDGTLGQRPAPEARGSRRDGAHVGNNRFGPGLRQCPVTLNGPRATTCFLLKTDEVELVQSGLVILKIALISTGGS